MRSITEMSCSIAGLARAKHALPYRRAFSIPPRHMCAYFWKANSAILSPVMLSCRQSMKPYSLCL